MVYEQVWHRDEYLFAAIRVRVAAEIFCIEVLKVRLTHSYGDTDSEVGVVDERHVIFINDVLFYTATNATGGSIAVFLVIYLPVDVSPSVVGNTVHLLVIQLIQGLDFISLSLLEVGLHKIVYSYLCPGDALLDSDDGDLQVVHFTIIISCS